MTYSHTPTDRFPELYNDFHLNLEDIPQPKTSDALPLNFVDAPYMKMEVLYIEWTGLAVNDVLFAQTVVYIAVQIDVRYAAVHDIVGHYALARNVSQLVAHIVVEARKVHIVVQKVCIVDVWNWGSELDGKNW